MHVEASQVLALVGPTASGKSAIALEVATRADVEIVAVDAFTVYRGMDIGTAKPSPEERRRVPHHMIDVLDPAEECSVEWFQGRARAAIADVLQRGRIPVLVGGSGLYFRAVVDDLRFPPTDPAARAAVVERVGGDPIRAHEELKRRDPAAAARIEPANLRRSVRALEVLDLTGRPFSSWRRAWSAYRSIYPGLTVLGVAIDRSDLDRRIAARARRMVTGGFLDEARRLKRAPLSHTAAAAIGYAEAFAHLDGDGSLDDTGTDALVEAIRLRTRRYAVRQQRWFEADPRIRWVTPDLAGEELVALCSS